MEYFDKEAIKSILPHREPMLLVDELILDDEGVGHGKYTIKEDEFFTRGHFPGNPIVPGVIQCEIMAQSCGILVKDDIPGNITLYAGLNNVRFKNSVKPGDTCEIECRLTDKKAGLYFCSAKLSVAGKLCCKADLTFALTPIVKD